MRSLIVAVAIIVSGCGANAATTSTPVTTIPSLGSTPGSAQPASPSALPSPSSTPMPTPRPTPTPTPVGVWSKPQLVGAEPDCSGLTAGIGVDSRYHIVAECGGSISYFVSDRNGGWSTTVFPHPANRPDLSPQIAFRGEVVYVAYTQVAANQEEGCGADTLDDVGVFYRRQLDPGGPWSDPVKIGKPTDSLVSFRIAGTTIHATVWDDTLVDALYYETQDGTSYHRYRVPHAIGGGSMRVGTDNRARIAYKVAGGLEYAIFTGSGFSTSRIVGSAEDDVAPLLVLDANDHAHLVWTRTAPEGGCVVREPLPDDGTYYATNASGKWESVRLTGRLGASLQVDEATGQVHIVVGDESGVRYYTRLPGGAWRTTRIAAASVFSSTIRLDPATGTLLVAYMRADSSGSSIRIYAMTRP